MYPCGIYIGSHEVMYWSLNYSKGCTDFDLGFPVGGVEGKPLGGVK